MHAQLYSEARYLVFGNVVAHFFFFCFCFVFVALRPMSTAMVIAGLNLTTLFPGQA